MLRSFEKSIKNLTQHPRLARSSSLGQPPRWCGGRGVGKHFGGQAIKAEPIRGHGMRDGLGAHLERCQIEVGYVIPCAVVVDVVRNAGLAAEEFLLGFRLEDLGAREKPARRNSRVQKRPVVGAAVKIGGHERFVGLVFEVIFKQPFSLAGAWRAGNVEGRSIPVIDAINIIRRRNHVEVEIQSDFVELGRGQRGDVEG